MRTARIARKTHETDIAVEVNLDGTGTYDVSTGIGFLDHMIEQFSRHSLIDTSTSTTRRKTAPSPSARPLPRRWATRPGSAAMARPIPPWTRR